MVLNLASAWRGLSVQGCPPDFCNDLNSLYGYLNFYGIFCGPILSLLVFYSSVCSVGD